MDLIEPSLEELLAAAALPAQAEQIVEFVSAQEEEELAAWLAELCENALAEEEEPAGLPTLLAGIVARYRQRAALPTAPPALGSEMAQQAAALYRALPPNSLSRGQLLSLLAQGGEEDALALLAQLIVEDPPLEPLTVSQALLPLFSREDFDPAALFPTLLDAVAHPAAAAAVLDLANHLTRLERLDSHPAANRGEQLGALLGELVGRLGKMAEGPGETGQQAARQVDERVSLVISLCYALALIGDEQAIGKLNQALELGHRRVRCEAAYALAKLGDKHGREELAKLAAEPMVRPRVIAYAEELGMAEEIEAKYTTPAARAEGELASWLALPTNLGLAPSHLETIDTRQLYWPGYDDPMECFLIGFSYALPQGRYTNVGIVGPLTHAFTADLTGLAADDAYAAFAGWQAEHEDIYQLDLERISIGQEAEIDRLERKLRDAKYENIDPASLGFFFGQRVLIARAEREGVPGIALADGEEFFWFPAGDARPIEPDLAYAIYKGRKLLRSFNE